jgi:hypothetical protein
VPDCVAPDHARISLAERCADTVNGLQSVDSIPEPTAVEEGARILQNRQSAQSVQSRQATM